MNETALPKVTKLDNGIIINKYYATWPREDGIRLEILRDHQCMSWTDRPGVSQLTLAGIRHFVELPRWWITP